MGLGLLAGTAIVNTVATHALETTVLSLERAHDEERTLDKLDDEFIDVTLHHASATPLELDLAHLPLLAFEHPWHSAQFSEISQLGHARIAGHDDGGAFATAVTALLHDARAEYEACEDSVELQTARQNQMDLIGSLGSLLIIAIGAIRSRREIKRRELSEHAAVNAKRFADSVFENIPHQIVVRDAVEFRYQRMNRAAEAFLGRTDLIGKSRRDMFEPELASRLEELDREALRTKLPVEWPDMLVPRAGGPARWLRVKTAAIHGHDGAPIGIISISEDVDDRHRFEDKLAELNAELESRVLARTEELARSQEQLLQAQKMEAVGRLAGGVAHDFNNLLTIIIGHTDLLCEELDEANPIRTDLVEVRDAAERAAGLTRQLLAFSRRQVLAPKLVNLDDIIAGMHKLLRRVIGEDVELRLVGAQQVGAVRVDPGQMEQVLMNLAVNARDAMPRGGTLVLETAAIELDGTVHDLPAGSYTMVSVRDSGTGMDDETKHRIFEPFFTTKGPGKGTGLGLATVFGIVQQSGGAIEVISQLAVGTTFRLYFPVAQGRATAQQAPIKAALPRGTESVLLVEDEDGVRSLFSNALTRAGYRVIEASNGEQALAVAASHPGPIDLLLSDVVMPKMSGRELLARVAEARPTMKVLFMSGYTDDMIIHHGIDRDFAFIQKPVTAEQLMHKVRAVLELTAAQLAEGRQ